MEESTFVHKYVLLYETVGSLNIKPGGLYVDGTLGGGGHAAAAGATVEGDPTYTRKVLVEAIRQVQSQGK